MPVLVLLLRGCSRCDARVPVEGLVQHMLDEHPGAWATREAREALYRCGWTRPATDHVPPARAHERP